MDSTDKRRASGAWPNWSRWAILAGTVILLAVAVDVLSGLVEPGASPDAASTPVSGLEPIRPEVAKLGRTGVRVEVVEGGYRLTQNHHDEAEADRLVACIEDGIATSPALTEGEAGKPPEADNLFARNARAKQVWYEVIRIHSECATDLDIAPPDDRPRRL